MLDAATLRRDFYYSPVLGQFFRRHEHQGNPPWQRAGYSVSKGYRQMRVKGVAYREHRLAWLYVHGAWPTHQIDHINRNAADNRIDNLRDATQSVNKSNSGVYRSNKSGFLGVCFYAPTQRWLAQITRNARRKHLGYFDTPEEAHAAYLKAREAHDVR